MSLRALLLLKSDHLWLTDDFRVTQCGRTLYDIRLQANHTLSDTGAIVVAALSKHTTYIQLMRIAQRHKIGLPALQQCLAELNAIGALAISRYRRTIPQGYWTRLTHLRFGILYAQQTRRSNLSVRHIMTALIRSTVNLWISIGFAFSMLSVIFPHAASHLLIVGIAVSFVTLASLLLHELSHMVALGKARASAVVVQQGSRVGILHHPLQPIHDIVVALIGPCIGSISAWLSALYFPSLLFSIIIGLVGVLHLCSLFPRYGDGATIRNALRQKELTNETTTDTQY